MAVGERSRNPLRARSSAEGAASLRAAGARERDPTVRCPDGLAREFLGGFNVTSLARHRFTWPLLIRAATRRAPGTYPYLVARCHLIDEILLTELRAGLQQVVLLGAGLDSTAYRLADHLRDVRVIEVDHPSSQATKLSKLRRIFGSVPEHVEFVAVDFGHDDLGERLAAAGHKTSAATLFIWSGVSMYLAESTVVAVLQWVSSHESSRTSILFDAVWAEAVDGSREYFGAHQGRRRAAAMDEPLRWGIPEGRVNETLARFELRAEAIYESADLTARYLVRQDGSTLGQPYGSGFIVHARSVAEAEPEGRAI
jgi:methyltransferase (TIGR00027 family)